MKEGLSRRALLKKARHRLQETRDRDRLGNVTPEACKPKTAASADAV
jgi:hypothetical protein